MKSDSIAAPKGFCGGGQTGDLEILKRDEKSTDMTVLTEAADFQTVIRYAQDLPCADAGQLVLARYSQAVLYQVWQPHETNNSIDISIIFC